MYIRKLAAAASFACGAALAFAPLAAADTSSDAASLVDTLIGGLPGAVVPDINLAISFDGMSLISDGTAKATTDAGQFGLAIAYGANANAIAEGGTGDYALASGTNALAHAGSLTATSGFDYDTAEDIGNNTAGGDGAPDGAYAGGGSLLVGDHDSAGTAVSSHDSAYLFGNTGPDAADQGGNSGAFAGDGQLIGASGAGSGDTAYLSGNILGQNDGPAAVAGNNDFASESGNESGVNEGAFAAFGNNNTAIADTNYTESAGVDAYGGNGNYAYVYGPDNSSADATGSDSNIAYVTDPYGMSGSADSATAGGAGGGHDIAEVLYTHGDASAVGTPNLYDIITPFGTSAGPAAATAAAESAAVTPITSTVSGEVTSINSLFETEAALAGDSADVVKNAGTFDTIPLTDAPHTGTASILDYELFGVNAIANSSGDPGAYDVFNGAEIRFDEAYNVASYALLNGGVLDPNSGDVFGAAIPGADTTAAEVVSLFYNDAIGDLSGFFQANLSAFDTTPAAVTELFSLFGSL